MSCVSGRTVDDEDDPKDVRVEVAGRVLGCLRPRVPHVRKPEGSDADQQQRDDEHADRPLLVCTQAKHSNERSQHTDVCKLTQRTE